MNNIENESIENIVAAAENDARQFNKDRLKTNQIRNFYSAVTKMRTEYEAQGSYDSIKHDLNMLKPKLAYAAGRQRPVRANFYPKMTAAIQGIIDAENKEKAIQNFFAYMESVVAYHKFYGDS